MRRLILPFTSLVLLLVITTQPVAAHVLKTDGTIGAILHILPDDNPKSGVSTSYELAFKDTENQFSLANCNCNVAILSDGKTIDTKALGTQYALISKNTYTFPKPNVYTLKVTGQPKEPNTYESFTLSYNVRVEAGKDSSTESFPLTLAIGMALMIGLILLGGYATGHNIEQSNNGSKDD